MLLEMNPVNDNLFQERLQLILEKLLATAESDPFENGNNGSVLLQVDSQGEYIVIDYPTCFLEYLEAMPKLCLEILAREEEWPIPWSTLQVPVLCSLFLFRGYPQPYKWAWILEHVEFWVTSTHGEVEVYLRAKSTLVQKILRKQRTTDKRQWAMFLLHGTIHDGGETVALFTRHDYRGQGVPWVRHRIKKLVLIRAFLVATMEMILTTWWHELGAPPIINQVNKHAVRHSLRMVSIWEEALRNARRVLQRRAVETAKLSQQRISEPTAGVPDGCSETEEGWETDVSDEYFSAEENASQNSGDTEEQWETEEEWEEGYMLDKAVDVGRPDDKNAQLRDSKRENYSPDMEDFDKDYWFHVCEQRNILFCGRQECRRAVPPNQGKLKRVAGAVAGYFLGSYGKETEET